MKFIEVSIECLEDIKVTSALNQVNSTESLSYIAGSAIRGAFIGNYIKLFNVKDINENEESNRWFFNNELEFFNGYIQHAGERTYPLPQGLYADSIGKFKYHSGDKVYVKNQITNKITETDKKFQPSEFAYFDDSKSLSGVSVNKLFNLHIRKGEERQMFRYEAIEKGQVFKSTIKATINDDELKKVKRVLKEGSFYIGGSKGSGYGKVKITSIEILDENPEFIKINNSIENEFIIFATSDGLYFDEFSNPISCIEEKWLEDKLGITNVKLENASIEETLVGGYNKKWGTRMPQYSAVKKGSIFKYSFNGLIDPLKAKELCNDAYGSRIEDGFGRFIILPFFDINSMQKANKTNKVNKTNKKLRIKYLDEEKQQLQFVVDSLARKRIQGKMKEIIVENYSTKGMVNNNQIGKLIQLFSQAQKKSSSEGIKYINNYFNHLENYKNLQGENKERINKEALNQLKDLILNNKKAIDFIKDEVKNISVEAFVREYSLNEIKIDGVKPILTLQEVYSYKMIELENTFRYILRSR